MFLRYFFLLFSILLVPNISFSQPWLYQPGLKTGGEKSFEQVRIEFDIYWLSHKREKGKGWKQFKRWEAFMYPRLYPAKAHLQSGAVVKTLKRANSHQLKSSGRWQSLGPSSVPKFLNSRAYMGAGRINAIEFHPTDDNIIWAGSPSGGFWKSADGGSTWKTTTDRLPAIGVSDIAVDFSDPDILYIASGDGDAGDTYSLGILKSVDGGDTWDTTSLSFLQEENIIIRRMAMNPANPKKILAATDEGVFLTTDGWNSHKLIRKGHFKDVEFNPSDASVAYVASYSEMGEAKIYRSSDGGVSFSKSMNGMDALSNVDRIELAVSPANADYVYALCSNADDGGFNSLWKSTDKGLSWKKMRIDEGLNLLGWKSDGSDVGGQGWYDLALTVSPFDESKVFVGGVNIWRSTDAGSNWKLSSNWQVSNRSRYVHADIHELCFSPSGRLFAGSDGGVNVSEDDGINWTDISNGLEILQVYRMGISNGGDVLVTGAQDNGTFLRDAAGNWHAVLDGDGFECFVDPENSSIVYGAYYYGDLYKSMNQGKNFYRITPEDALVDNVAQGGWLTPYIISAHDNDVLYAGYSKLYRTDNGGLSWKAISPELDDIDKLQVIAESPSDPDVLYVSNINTIWKTTDQGKTWKTLPPNLPDLAITDIVVHPTDPNKIWVSLSGYTSKSKVFISYDGGKTFDNYSDGLPNLPVNCLYIVEKTNKLVYAGTDNGIYYRNNTMDSWLNCNDNLPNVIVNDIAINQSTNSLILGTYGRGLWRSDFILDSSSVYYADFEAKFKQVCADKNVTLRIENKSYGDFDSLVWNFGKGAIPETAYGQGSHDVSFPVVGTYDISLKAYNKWGVFTEIKAEAVEAVDEITSLFEDPQLFHCTPSVMLSPATDSELTWYKEDELVYTGNEYLFDNRSFSVLHVEGTQGRCPATDSVWVSFVPDNVCDAMELGYGNWGPFSNRCATAEQGEPLPDTLITNACNTQDSWCPENGIQNSVWFSFVASQSGSVYIKAPGFDNQIALYQAETCEDIFAGNFILIAANDDYDVEDNSAVILEKTGLEPGKKYWIQLDGSGGGVHGEFYLIIAEMGPLTASFSADKLSLSPGGKVVFKDASMGLPDSWYWQFEGGEPNNSKLQNPSAVTYRNEGEYTVSLIITKGGVSDTLINKYYIKVSSNRFVCDTITNITGSKEVYFFEDNTFISGTNSYGDRALAEKFWVEGDDIEVAGMFVDWAYATGNKGDEIRFQIHAGDDLPDRIIGTSFVSLGEIITDYQYGNETYASFSPRIAVSNNFFAAISLPQIAGDTIAVYTSAEMEASQNTAYQANARGQWSSYKWLYGSDFNLKMSVNVCLGPDKISAVSIGPVPAHKKLNLMFGTFDGNITKIIVVDYLGKSMFVDSSPELNGSVYTLNTMQFATGVYVVKIESDKGIVAKKFVKY